MRARAALISTFIISSISFIAFAIWPVSVAADQHHAIQPTSTISSSATWHFGHAVSDPIPDPIASVPSPPTTTPSAPVVVAPAPTIQSADVTDADRAAWSKVAVCETGGDWQMTGSSFSGGVGFANSTWLAYGGAEFAPNAGLATMDQQITIAKRIQSNPPDQGGCSGGW